jgi:hypothetical protein
MAAHQRWWVEALLSVIIGSQAATEQLSAPERSAVWSFVAAAVDGMTLHRALDPESYPFHAVLEVLRQFIARMEDTPGDR